MATIKLENGLLKFKVAPIQEGGTYGEIVECADLSSMTAETAEGKQFCRVKQKYLILLLRKKTGKLSKLLIYMLIRMEGYIKNIVTCRAQTMKLFKRI